ncbi:unnamed protein product, partial [Polarella glacialis]
MKNTSSRPEGASRHEVMSSVKNDVLLPDSVRDYIKEHSLERIISTALNTVIYQMPEDPFAQLAEELSKSSSSSPYLNSLSADCTAPRRELRFDVVVATRGVRIRIHNLSMRPALLPSVEESAEAARDKAKQAQEEEKLITFLQDFFATAFGDAYVDDYLTFHERCSGLSAAPLPGGVSVDLLTATLALTNELHEVGASALDIGSLEFLQRVLS